MNIAYRKPWYHEPWVWFNLILLSVSVLAASLMSLIALWHTPAEIGSSWYQEGVLAKRERHQEAFISKIHLQGSMMIRNDGRISLTTQHDPVIENKNRLKGIDVKTLHLYIAHPIDPKRDQFIILKRCKTNGYCGQLDALLQGKHRLMITTKNNRWYLISEGYFPQVGALKFTPVMR